MLFSFKVKEEVLRYCHGIFCGGRVGTLDGRRWKEREKPGER